MRQPSSGAARASLTEGPIFPTLVRLAMPIVLAQFLQTIYNVVDTFWVGRLGADAVAAITLSFPIIIVLLSLAGGLTIGGTALVAQYTGARQPEKAGEVAAQSLLAILVVSVVLGVVGVALAGPLLRLVGATDSVLPMAKTYLVIFMSGVGFVFLSFAYSSILRGVGDTMTPLKLRAVATAINIILDPILIFGWLGFPAMGIAGAALATVIALGIEGIWGLLIMLRGIEGLRVRKESFRPNWPVIKEIFRIGSPAALEMTAGTMGLSLLTAIVALAGMHAVAAFGIGMRVQSLVLLPAFGAGMAATTLVGQNLGAGKPERAERTAWVATAATAGAMMVFGLIGLAFPRFFIGIFNDHPDVLHYGAAYMQIAGPAFGLIGVRIILSSAFRGAGDTLPAMVLSIVLVLALEVPLAYLFSQTLGWGPNGIWWGTLIAATVGAVWASLWFRRGKWKTKAVVGHADGSEPSLMASSDLSPS